ncbi:MAG: glycosyltransferase family 1 protein [Lunatimonas sp.]|uniref:glycosyltransferase n=1 Tax=Lunatimonas sp. TaxID=2060141 RepID=UPI00263BE20D|nr:glycosyltransferase [Lunatimonas sp.]MCC5939140.1 glycosyltransferase family 1 protein [Lunatimonas sp.]
MNSVKSVSPVVLMDPFPAMGHVQAFLNLADWMKELGYEVVFLTAPDYSALVGSKGYRVILVNPFLLIPERSEIEANGWISLLAERLSGRRKPRLMEEMRTRRLEYVAATHTLSPSLVLLDDHFALKAYLYERMCLPTVLVSTMTLPHRAPGIPPFQSVRFPARSVFCRLLVRASWFRIDLTSWYNGLWKRLLLGNSRYQEVIRAKYRPSKLSLDTSRCFGIGINELPIIATYPKSFDFAAPFHQGEKYYFGKLPEVLLGQPLEDRRLHRVIDLAKSSGKKLIFCSLGTVTVTDLTICERFFNKVIRLASHMQDVFFVLSVGAYLDVRRLCKTPSNVAVFPSVAQKALLPQVDLMIHHGGINSIKECIAAGLPMLAYPLSLKWDQPGCAARLVYLGLGQMGNIRKDSGVVIQQKIRHMLDHATSYREAIRAFRHTMGTVNELEHKRLADLLAETKLLYPTTQTKSHYYETV